MDKKIECGKRLKECRLEAGITQKELADKINITYQSISNIECGKRSLTVENARSCAKILNVRIEYLLCEDDKKHPPILPELTETLKNIENARNRFILFGLFDDIVETDDGFILAQSISGEKDFILCSYTDIEELCKYVRFMLDGWAENKFNKQYLDRKDIQDHLRKLYMDAKEK